MTVLPHSLPSEQTPGTAYSACLVLDKFSITIHITKNEFSKFREIGSGHICAHDEDLEWGEEDETRVLKLSNEDMIALRDLLVQRFPLDAGAAPGIT